ncbi:hypothetical protein F2P81_026049 [Scophthalmus maximus]|uniref:Uncharacterized protein n=1 Tax=Scophthalmus maximus TaxID=52904 RepID=A0A6A4RNF2_SCOMX|nr:hypothetical protein F2P81_026049 [Scophthalmus maximus]
MTRPASVVHLVTVEMTTGQKPRAECTEIFPSVVHGRVVGASDRTSTHHLTFPNISADQSPAHPPTPADERTSGRISPSSRLADEAEETLRALI